MAARPAPTQTSPERVVLIGCAGSGKTTLARALAARLGARHIERDALGDDEASGFAAQARPRSMLPAPGGCSTARKYNAEMVVYPHADTVVALDYPRRIV